MWAGTRNRLLAVAAASLAVAAALPAASDASCGGVQTARPAHHRHRYRPPLAIGDSTMLLALPDLAHEGFEVNAHGCRGFDEGLALLRARRRAGTLPHLVVMALGTDWSISRSQVWHALELVGRRRVLGLVTPWELGGYAGSDAAVVREEARRHPHRIVLLDWVAYSRGHGGWFQPDGCHLTFAGAHAFARFLGRAMRYAAPPKPPRPKPKPKPKPPAPQPQPPAPQPTGQ